MLAVVSRRVLRLLVRCGRLLVSEDGYEVVPLEESGVEASTLAGCQSASVPGRIAGPRAGGR